MAFQLAQDAEEMGGDLCDGIVAELLVLDYKGLAADLSDCPRTQRKWVGILAMALWLTP